MPLFEVGGQYPPYEHRERIKRYRDNKKLFLGNQGDVFKKVQDKLTERHAEIIYIAANLPGLICRKSADLLFGETPIFSAGKEDDSDEQKAFDRLVSSNDLNITNYESAMGNAYRGDSFYKIRWGQTYGGEADTSVDPYRVIIESQKAQYVFPETVPGDENTILAYHIAVPVERGEQWELMVETHYPGKITHSKYLIEPTSFDGHDITEWNIIRQLIDLREDVHTGVGFPLVFHIPNYSTDESWHGIDDLSEHKAIFDEISNRLSQIAIILDKHADPLMAVPTGVMDIDANGLPQLRVANVKVIEVTDKNDAEPKYVTWDGQLEACFKELDRLIDMLLMTAEIPPVALGRDNSGTSGASGLSIKWRMSSLLAKINRKRQYYEKGLKHILLTAQLLEKANLGKVDYEITLPHIVFKDGLPDDELEQAQIAQIRTAGKPTMSQKTAIRLLDGLTDQQAESELDRIRSEELHDTAVDSSIFNKASGGAN